MTQRVWPRSSSDGIDHVVSDDRPFDLVSFSFGGVLSGLLAHQQSRRIRALTLVGSPVLGLTGSGPANELVEVPQDLPPDEAAPLYRHNLQKLMVCDPEAADALAVTIQTQNMSKARLRSRGIARTSVLADSLRDLPCRLNCVFGDADVTLDPDLDGIRAYKRNTPRRSFPYYSGCRALGAVQIRSAGQRTLAEFARSNSDLISAVCAMTVAALY